MEELLQFLMDKCRKGLEEAKEKCVDPSLVPELESIEELLKNSSSTPVKLKDNLYDLISTLTDITTSHTHKRPVRIICFPLQICSRRKNQKRDLREIKAALQNHPDQGPGPTDGSPDSKEEDGAGPILDLITDKREQIEECLVQNRGGHIEIGIVGMCGSGKTTLAQFVYDKEIVDKEFEHRIWVNLPHKLTSNDTYFVQILSFILKQCGEDKGGEGKDVPAQCTKQQLLRIIRNRLLGKSYLLVLDGVWDADMDWYFELGKALDWHYKDGDFGKDGSKSAVIITTRLEEPAKTMVGNSALHHIHPQDFSKDTCWSIFIDQVKRGGKIDKDNASLLELENDIKEQCDGLPLAAVTLAEIIPELIG